MRPALFFLLCSPLFGQWQIQLRNAHTFQTKWVHVNGVSIDGNGWVTITGIVAPTGTVPSGSPPPGIMCTTPQISIQRDFFQPNCATSLLCTNEVVSTVYPLSLSPAGAEVCYRNGMKQSPNGIDYTLAGQSLTFSAAPNDGDILECDYPVVGPGGTNFTGTPTGPMQLGRGQVSARALSAWNFFQLDQFAVDCSQSLGCPNGTPQTEFLTTKPPLYNMVLAFRNDSTTGASVPSAYGTSIGQDGIGHVTFLQPVTVQNALFTGTGLNDMGSTGWYTGTSTSTYTVQIDSVSSDGVTPDTFEWSKDGGTVTAGVAIVPGASMPLAEGVQVSFTASLGHTLGDSWSIRVIPAPGHDHTDIVIAYQTK